MKFHARGLFQVVDSKFFYPAQSAVLITPPLTNENVITTNTLIDKDPDSVVDESNTAFDDFATRIYQSFGGTALCLSYLSAPPVFPIPSQLEDLCSDESERKNKLLRDNSEDASISEILILAVGN